MASVCSDFMPYKQRELGLRVATGRWQGLNGQSARNSIRAAVKNGALQRHHRLVLDRREHGGMINAQGAEENTEMTGASLSTRIQNRSAQRAELLIITHSFL
jgi:hypothetical protein